MEEDRDKISKEVVRVVFIKYRSLFLITQGLIYGCSSLLS